MLFFIKFDLFERFFGSGSFKSWWSSTKPLNLGSGVTYGPPDTHGYPGGGGVVFSKDLGQLESRLVSVCWYFNLEIQFWILWDCHSIMISKTFLSFSFNCVEWKMIQKRCQNVNRNPIGDKNLEWFWQRKVLDVVGDEFYLLVNETGTLLPSNVTSNEPKSRWYQHLRTTCFSQSFAPSMKTE